MTYAPSTSNQTSNGNPYLQFSGYVTVNIVEGWNWYTGVDPALIGSNQYDYQTVVTHELGHAVGLYHDPSTYVGFNDDNHSVMYPSRSSGLTRRNFSVYDYDWMQYLYASAAYPGSNGVPEQVDPQVADLLDETTAAPASASELDAAAGEVVDTASRGERFQFIKADFRDRGVLVGLFELQTFGVVFQPAIMAGVRASVEYPLLEAAHGRRLADFVFASSSSIYGNTRCLLMAPSWSFLTHGLASIHTDWILGLEPWAVSGLGLHWQLARGLES